MPGDTTKKANTQATREKIQALASAKPNSASHPLVAKQSSSGEESQQLIYQETSSKNLCGAFLLGGLSGTA